MQVVEEKPEEDDSTVYKGIGASVFLTSPTHSNMENQLKQLPNIVERHRSADYPDDDKDTNYLNVEESKIQDKSGSFNVTRIPSGDVVRGRRFSDIYTHEDDNFW